MHKFWKRLSAVAVGVGLLSLPALAQAQELTVRAEPGVAIPTTDPQADRFNVGGAMAVKPELGLGSVGGLKQVHWGVGPSLQFMALPSSRSGVDAGTAWSFGGFLRVKRSHGVENTGQGWSAVSPWVDSDLKYVRTDGLDRLGWSLAAGAHVPTSDSRQLWVGPFVRYDLVNQEDGKSGINTNSAKTVIVGVSFELGAKVAKKQAPPPPYQPPPPPPPVEEPQPVPPPVEEVKVEFKPRIQFAWDSYELEPAQLEPLRNVVSAMLDDKSYNVKIEGHASSEGTVEHNDKLSQNRANAVLEFLVANGVDRSRLSASGFGSRVPVADNATEAGRVANRRVEFDVTFVLVRERK